MSRLQRCLLAAGLTIGCHGAVVGATHALLVGVGGYPSLQKQYRLRGPRNDVILMRDALQAWGVDDITILADGTMISQALPTRGAILDSIEALISRARPGDWIVLYFSGHGSRQPQPVEGPRNGWVEPDGLDEIFLPYDIGHWAADRQTVDNALVDDDIDLALREATKRRVSVWAIFDSCHAGGMLKTLPAGTVEGPEAADDDESAAPLHSRGVSPSLLGIPEHPAAAAAGNAASVVGKALRPASQLVAKVFQPGAPPPAALVGFYAVSNDQVTGEERVRRGPLGHERVVGVFTRHLSEALVAARTQAHPTFESLMRDVQQAYAGDPAGRRVAPFLEGSGERELLH